MKRIALASALAACALLPLSANAAGSAADSFNVNIALTTACTLTTPGALAMTYTAFGAAATGFTSFDVKCSQGLGFGLGLDAATVTDGATGLPYTLALKAANLGDASVAAGTLTGQAGTAAGTTYYVQGYIAAGQAGTTTPGAANNTRTVTVSY